MESLDSGEIWGLDLPPLNSGLASMNSGLCLMGVRNMWNSAMRKWYVQWTLLKSGLAASIPHITFRIPHITDINLDRQVSNHIHYHYHRANINHNMVI